MLAAWMRMKYPHVLDGAIAGSAPIWTFIGEVRAAYRSLRTRTHAPQRQVLHNNKYNGVFALGAAAGPSL